jgi:predicted DNA-binding ArsR family transcriptional regulator
MKDQHQLDERAAEAKNILNSPLFKEVLEVQRNWCVNRLRECKVGSDDANEAHAMLKTVDMFETSFRSIIADQKMDQYYRKTQHGT